MAKRITIDMDGVIANLLSEWVRRYNYDFDDNLNVDQINVWDWHELTKSSCQEKVYDYLDDPEIFENLPVIEGSQEVTYELSKKYELFICTAAWNVNNIPSKSIWLQKHFPHIKRKNYVFARNKSILNTDWLIDDKVENFKGLDAQGLLFTAAHNKKENRYPRVNNWNQVLEYFDWVEGLDIIGD